MYPEIVRLRLVNFAHFTSIGLPDLEIDRRGSQNNIILILGSNGSGKSLLTQAWSLYPNESTNNRKKVLIEEGKDGIKEVDVIFKDDEGNIGDYIYKIRIIYGEKSTNCSLIQEDLVTGEQIELNPNGLVSSYEESINSIFKVTKTYKNIGFISPQVTSLVKMSPATRFEYISTWLPDIETYMEAYKTIMKRINTYNRHIKMLESDIGDINLSNITLECNMKKTRLLSIDKELNELNEYKINLDTVNRKLPVVNSEDLQNLSSSINKNEKILKDFLDEMNRLSQNKVQYSGEEGKKKLEKRIEFLSNDIKNINDKMGDIEMIISQKKNSIKETEYNLGLLNISVDIEQIQSTIDEIEKKIVSSKQIIENYEIEYHYLKDLTISSQNVVIVERTFETIKEYLENITDTVPLDKIDYIDDFSISLDKKVENGERSIKLIDKDIQKTLERITLLKNSPLDESILSLIPELCNFNCGVIEEIKRLLSPDKEIEKLQENLDKLYKDKDIKTNEIEANKTLGFKTSIVLGKIREINSILMRDKDYICQLPIEVSDKSISLLINDMNSIMKVIEVSKEYTSIKEMNIGYKETIKSLYEKEKSVKISINMHKNLKDLYDDVSSMDKEYSNLSQKCLDEIEELKSLSELSEKLESLNKDLEEYNTKAIDHNKSKENYKRYCNIWYYKIRINNSLNWLNNQLMLLNDEKNQTNNELKDLETLKIQKQTLIDKRDNCINQIKQCEFLQEAWNPKTGIPSIFIGNFLSRIHAKSNEYLQSLNGDDLKIVKFEIGKTAREFPIVIDNKGQIINDASECSDGQIALITLAVSMALIKEAVGKDGYNIIRLDELDAPLDKARKKLYIDMIMDKMREIHSRQCIIISHSPEFENVEADVIILPEVKPNPDLLKNKFILLDVA
jgi:DNA repair exonuclease SbcCD ATPase subunit